MKRLLPLLFLVPSLALIIYAKRDAGEEVEAPPPYEVRVQVVTGGFEFPPELALWVSTEPPGAFADDLVESQRVTDGWATVPATELRPMTLHLTVFSPWGGEVGATGIPVGKPRECELLVDGKGPTGTLTVTPDECRAALAHLRKSG